MDHRDPQPHHHRLYVLGGFLGLVLLIYAGVLYNIQVINHDDYLQQSIRTIAQPETVEAARGILTDRNGQLMVSNRSTYDLTFDTSLLKNGEDVNEAILRLLELCQSQGKAWEDTLPLTLTSPFSYTLDTATDQIKGRFWAYLRDLDFSAKALGTYLLDHPELLETTDETGETVNPAEEILADPETSDNKKAQQLLEKFPEEKLTSELLMAAGVTPDLLVVNMRADAKLPATYSLAQARLVLGVRYELRLRRLDNYDAYVMVRDIDTAFISLLSDGGFSGAKVISSSVREYETDRAPHILGYVAPLDRELDDVPTLLGQGYGYNDKIGRTGVERAFESYLKGTDGTRIVSTNADGKITGEYWKKEPEPGNTVELTIDLDIQAVMEDTLAQTVTAMNRKDGDETRGAAAVLLGVDNAEVLGMVSFPDYDLATFRQDAATYAALRDDPARPLNNRATNGRYAPGSTFKPLTSVAALEEGVVSLTERINCTGRWYYPDMIAGAEPYRVNCWNRSGHGRLNITGAITNSCNCYFCEMGYRLGIDKLTEYATAFGLGQNTGIEIGDNAGVLAGPEFREAQGGTWYGGDTVNAAYGQSDHLFTPLQLANYIATLVNGGNHYEPHLLKTVKSYDNAQVVAVGGAQPVNTIDISDSTLKAVKEGMLGYTQPGGSVYSAFRNCVVTAGAKTGTAQLGANITNNGVFVCFAPYDDPEVALAIVIERAEAGANLATTAVEILNAYFTADETGETITGEYQLLE